MVLWVDAKQGSLTKPHLRLTKQRRLQAQRHLHSVVESDQPNRHVDARQAGPVHHVFGPPLPNWKVPRRWSYECVFHVISLYEGSNIELLYIKKLLCLYSFSKAWVEYVSVASDHSVRIF
jgi:hypothetical protein